MDIAWITDNPPCLHGVCVLPRKDRQNANRYGGVAVGDWYYREIGCSEPLSLFSNNQPLFSCFRLQWLPHHCENCGLSPALLHSPTSITSPHSYRITFWFSLQDWPLHLFSPHTSGALLYQLHQPICSPPYLSSLISLSSSHRLVLYHSPKATFLYYPKMTNRC